MNAEILRAAGIDYDFCVKRFVGRAQLFEKSLRRFSKDKTFSRVRAAFEEGNDKALLASAHEFKGMCGNLGLTGLYEGADRIVRLLRAERHSKEELGEACAELDGEYDAVHAAVLASMEETI